MSLFHRFLQQCQQHLPHQTDFLVGLSGGVDSVALLHLFSRTNFNVRAIYVHHGLSPNADSWAAFCEQTCKRLNIPFILQNVVVDKSQGVENGARAARYQAVGQNIQPNEVFVTAHHLDDQAETFLLALKRGSGIKGLSAMQAVNFLQNFTIFRPLLTFPKTDLLAYAAQHQLAWIEDESNADNRFDRNFLRNSILPQLNHRWQQFSQMVARSAQHCAEQQALIEELLSDELSQRMGEKQQLAIHGFAELSSAKQQQLIRLWLEKNNVMMPSQAQLQAVISELIFAKQDKNPQVKLGENVIRRYQQAIFVTDEVGEVPAFTVVIPPTVSLCETTPPKGGRKVAFEISNAIFSSSSGGSPYNAGEGGIILPHNLGTITRTQNELICKKNGKTYRLLLPIELADQPLTLKIGHQGKVKLYGKPHHEEMKKIWQQNNVPVWERASTLLAFWNEEFVGVFAYDSLL